MIGKIINNYVIERKIGDGGMGVVYYARHNRVEREVAIKVLHSNLFTNENIRNRFKNEANALIKLNHKNIVQIFDYVEQGNFACLIMEYINGYTLDEYINKKSGPLPSSKATHIISSVLDAVQFAHDNNVYHRDIKPGNIMICKEGLSVKIMDFGIAKLTDSSNLKTTHANAQLGTPFYMSPEQVKGLPFTRISDIYSLGVTLYEMVTGKCPYGEITNLFELQSKIVNEPLPPTSLYYPSVSPRLQQAILIATNKIPEQRFQNCNEFKKYLHEEDNRPFNIQQPQQIVQKTKPVKIKEQISAANKVEIKNPVPNTSVVTKGAKRNYWWVYLIIGIIIVGAAAVYYNNFKSEEFTEDPKIDSTQIIDPTKKQIITNATNTTEKPIINGKTGADFVVIQAPELVKPPIVNYPTKTEIENDFRGNIETGQEKCGVPLDNISKQIKDVSSKFSIPQSPLASISVNVFYTIWESDMSTKGMCSATLIYDKIKVSENEYKYQFKTLY